MADFTLVKPVRRGHGKKRRSPCLVRSPPSLARSSSLRFSRGNYTNPELCAQFRLQTTLSDQSYFTSLKQKEIQEASAIAVKNPLGAFVQNLAYMWKSFSKLGQEDAVLGQEYVPGGDSQR